MAGPALPEENHRLQTLIVQWNQTDLECRAALDVLQYLNEHPMPVAPEHDLPYPGGFGILFSTASAG
jgi:hypothetical protein